MDEFRFKLRRRELLIIYILVSVFVIECVTLLLAVYYARFPVFIALFIKSLRILSPIFLALNVLFLISTMFVRGKKLIVRTWRTYIREFFRFFAVSLAITIVLLFISAFLGVLIAMLLRQLSHIPSMENIMDSLREWAARSFYDSDEYHFRSLPSSRKHSGTAVFQRR